MSFINDARFRLAIQVGAIFLVLLDWQVVHKSSWEKLPFARAVATDVLNFGLFSASVAAFALYRWRLRRGGDADNAWQSYVVAFLWVIGLNGVAQTWLESPFAVDVNRHLSIGMTAAYSAIASTMTIYTPGKRPRSLAGTLAPLAELPLLYLIPETRQFFLSDGIFVMLAIFAGLMLAVRETIQRALNRSHFDLAATQLELAASEVARRSLEVDRAIGAERERLMHEVHDGIGSSLVLALAVAQREPHSGSTVNLLKQAILDLKLTVDSLDTMGGDILALLGNVRHRLEPDLKRSGVLVEWHVAKCPMLGWLDASNALHFLRLIQEAVSNVLAHSGARGLTFRCNPVANKGRDGIEVQIIDNGLGFDPSEIGKVSKGLASMRSRANALHGSFDCQSTPGEGTRISIWLPLELE